MLRTVVRPTTTVDAQFPIGCPNDELNGLISDCRMCIPHEPVKVQGLPSCSLPAVRSLRIIFAGYLRSYDVRKMLCLVVGRSFCWTYACDLHPCAHQKAGEKSTGHDRMSPYACHCCSSSKPLILFMMTFLIGYLASPLQLCWWAVKRCIHVDRQSTGSTNHVMKYSPLFGV